MPFADVWRGLMAGPAGEEVGARLLDLHTLLGDGTGQPGRGPRQAVLPKPLFF